MKNRNDYIKNMEALARDAMGKHVIIKSSEDRWTIARGEGNSIYRAEIVLLEWGRIIVHGDITPVIFRGCGDRGVQGLEYIIRRPVAEIARDKISDNEGETRDEEVFVAEMREHIKENFAYVPRCTVEQLEKRCLRDEWRHSGVHSMAEMLSMLTSRYEPDSKFKDREQAVAIAKRAMLEEGIRQVEQSEVSVQAMSEAIYNHNLLDIECVSGMGRVAKPSVFYAYAAVKRCVELLRAQAVQPAAVETSNGE